MAGLAPTESGQITLLDQRIDYTLRRSSRKTLGLSIDGRGLIVSIPSRLSLREAERFMLERAKWITEKLAQWAARQSSASAPVLQITDGMTFSLLGAPCTVRLLSGANRARWIEGHESREIHLALREGADAKLLLLRSVQRYALTYFRGRVQEFGVRLNALSPATQIPSLRLTNARTRWGSCSQRSGIRLNWRLIHLPFAQIDYVVAHELSHLLEMNHSARFWKTVAQLYPPYEGAHEALKSAHKFIPAW